MKNENIILSYTEYKSKFSSGFNILQLITLLLFIVSILAFVYIFAFIFVRYYEYIIQTCIIGCLAICIFSFLYKLCVIFSIVKIKIENNSDFVIVKTVGKEIIERISYPLSQIKYFTLKKRDIGTTMLGVMFIDGKYKLLYTIKTELYVSFKCKIQKYSGIEVIDIDDLLTEADSKYTKADKDNPEELTEILELYKSIIEICPVEAEAYENIGSIYENLENYEAALFNLNKALEHNYKYKDLIYDDIGNIKEELGDYHGAIEAYQMAQKEARTYDSVYYIAEAKVYEKLKNYEKAMELYNETINKDSIDDYAYKFRMECAYRMKDYKRALDDFLIVNEFLSQENISKNSKTEIEIELEADTYYWGYLIYTALNNTEEANKYYKLTYEVNKNFDVNKFNKDYYIE